MLSRLRSFKSALEERLNSTVPHNRDSIAFEDYTEKFYGLDRLRYDPSDGRLVIGNSDYYVDRDLKFFFLYNKLAVFITQDGRLRYKTINDVFEKKGKDLKSGEFEKGGRVFWLENDIMHVKRVYEHNGSERCNEMLFRCKTMIENKDSFTGVMEECNILLDDNYSKMLKDKYQGDYDKYFKLRGLCDECRLYALLNFMIKDGTLLEKLKDDQDYKSIDIGKLLDTFKSLASRGWQPYYFFCNKMIFDVILRDVHKDDVINAFDELFSDKENNKYPGCLKDLVLSSFLRFPTWYKSDGSDGSSSYGQDLETIKDTVWYFIRANSPLPRYMKDSQKLMYLDMILESFSALDVDLDDKT